MAAIIHNNSPYVHSNIYRFQAQMHDLNSSEDNSLGRQRIEQIKDSLTQTADLLKQETIHFVKDYGIECGNNLQLAGSKLTELLLYSGGNTGLDRETIFKAMRDRNTLHEVTNAITKVDIQDIQNSSLTQDAKTEILSMITNNTQILDVNQVVQHIISKKVAGKKISKDELHKMFKEIFSDKDILTELTNETKKGLTSTSKELQKRLLKAIQKSTKGSSVGKIIPKVLAHSICTRAKEYGKNIGISEKQLADAFSTVGWNAVEINNLKGELGDIGQVSIINASDNSIGMAISVGSIEEQNVAKEIWEKYRIKIDTLKTFHNQEKQSQSDMILISPKGKTARVQSKNALQALFDWQDKGNTPALMKIQETARVIDLLNDIQKFNYINDQDVGDLSYMLANAVWFERVGDINEDTRRKISGTEGEGGISGIYAEVNKRLSAAVTGMLGITVGDAFNGLNVSLSGSNLFILLSSSVYVPTALVLYSLIEQLDNMNSLLFRLRITVNRQSATFKYKKRKDFYKAKQDATGGLQGHLNYQDENLLAVGSEQGEGIMETLKVGRINLIGDVKKLFTSSFGVNVDTLM